MSSSSEEIKMIKKSSSSLRTKSEFITTIFFKGYMNKRVMTIFQQPFPASVLVHSSINKCRIHKDLASILVV